MKTELHRYQRRTCLYMVWLVMLRQAENAIDEALITRSNPDRWYPNDPETATIGLNNAIDRATNCADAALECLATHEQRKHRDFKRLGIKVKA